jgi:hypothetical protein
MYDPELSLTGSQPLYFDQLAAIYDHYTVFASRIIVEVLNAGSGLGVGVVYVEDDTSIVTSFKQAAEQPSATLAKTIPSKDAQAKPVVFRKSWDAKSYFGGDIYDNDNLQGNASSNPSEQSYYTVVFSGLASGGSVDEMTAGAYVTIEYDAVWDELRTMARS